MLPDHAACYQALLTHDRRFDGRFYVGVSSTGIYCRPVCPARTPKPENCRFFDSAAAAEQGGYRPCLRCRPELAPGCSSVDASSRLAWAAAQRIEAGDDAALETVAQRLGVSDRHLRRVFQGEFGVTPVAWQQTQRLLLAKQLLTDTRLPITELALAAGFHSLRRFNALFRSRYGLTPGALRRDQGLPASDAMLSFQLGFRPPFDAGRLLAFLAYRCIAGVEQVEGGCYRRTVRIRHGDAPLHGWIEVEPDLQRNLLVLRVSPSLSRGLPCVLAAVRRVFDLACDPVAVAAALGPLAADAPGLRVPGSFDGFEMAVRAILGQQVTVKAAHTLAGRLVSAFGMAVETPHPALNRLFPTPERLIEAGPEALGALGIVRQRGQAICALAQALGEGRLDLGPTADVEMSIAGLRALPGIGPWTAHYIALRAFSWPDAWPSGDVILIKALGAGSAREADLMAQAWQPWRSYATLHLWRRHSEQST